jgi:hypothetical protein
VYAVLVKDFLTGGTTYMVSLVATDGHVAAGATVPKRSTRVQVGSLSTSTTTLYYLDGDSDIRFLRPEPFAKGIATHVTLGPNQVAAFAVSPDDRRIAVSVLDYTRYPVSTRLYVEDLSGGGNHIELFSSTTVLEWPVGWHNGRLIVAVGRNAQPQNAGEWFERGHGYHVADAKTGSRLGSLCDQGDSYIPESPAGIVCSEYPNVSVISWDGASRPAPKDGTCAMWGPLSPDGVMANRLIAVPGGCTSGDNVFLIKADGTRDSRSLAQRASPEGWMDSTHFVVAADPPPFAQQDFEPGRSVVDTSTGLTSTIQGGQGFFAAAIPGGL